VVQTIGDIHFSRADTDIPGLGTGVRARTGGQAIRIIIIVKTKLKNRQIGIGIIRGGNRIKDHRSIIVRIRDQKLGSVNLYPIRPVEGIRRWQPWSCSRGLLVTKITDHIRLPDNKVSGLIIDGGNRVVYENPVVMIIGQVQISVIYLALAGPVKCIRGGGSEVQPLLHLIGTIVNHGGLSDDHRGCLIGIKRASRGSQKNPAEEYSHIPAYNNMNASHDIPELSAFGANS